MIDVKIEAVVKNLSKETKFLQPIFEAISNSLEANATEIDLTIFSDEPLDTFTGKIIGFKIIDNGDGFTKRNRDAFALLWTDNKIELGCKGSGRFTWLSVFEKIDVVSLVKEENVEVKIPFDLNFDKEKIEVTDTNVSKNYTEIFFKNVTKKFLYVNNDGRRIDNRSLADIQMLKECIRDYLLVKLFLLKKDGRNFRIRINVKKEYAIIDNDSIADLQFIIFEIKNPFKDETFLFYLYYQFKEDGNNTKKIFYCSNNRSTKLVEEDVLGLSCALPNKDSFIMLLCSSYFDGKDDDSRSDLTRLLEVKVASIFVPILLSDITPQLRKNAHKIIIDKYPQLTNQNKTAEDDAIKEMPYLAEFIKKDKDIIKSKEVLISKASKEFISEKIRVKDKFEKILSDKEIDPEEFTNAVNDISIIASAELGEYILYRDNIIRALKNSMNNPLIMEKFLHNIFMPMRKTIYSENDEKHLLSNLWLFDDKFMTYSYAASDITINQIVNTIKEKNEKIFKKRNRPDLTVFYNNINGIKDVLMVEFKGINADGDEKNKSLSELPNDIAIIRKNIDNINTIWGYIVTTIDDDFAFTIENDGRFNQLFTTEDNKRFYYGFFKNLNAHIYIIDLNVIVSDSASRNKTFLEILKK